MAPIMFILTQRELQIFERTCFGYFLQFKDMRFDLVLVHLFILREVIRRDMRDQLWFQINGVNMRFSLYEFALVTDLYFSTFTNIAMYMPQEARNRIRDTYFKGVRSMTHSDIKRVFIMRPQGGDDDDVVKLALLYCFHMVLLGNDDNKKVNIQFLQLVDYYDGFNVFPWVKLAWDTTYQSICKAITKLSLKPPTTNKRKYNIVGFPQVLR